MSFKSKKEHCSELELQAIIFDSLGWPLAWLVISTQTNFGHWSVRKATGTGSVCFEKLFKYVMRKWKPALVCAHLLAWFLVNSLVS